MKRLHTTLALLLATVMPLTCLAAPGGGRPAGGNRPSGGARPAAQSRPAQQPANRGNANGSGGFNFNRDVNAAPPKPAQQPANNGNRNNANNNGNRTNVNNNGNRTNVNNNGNRTNVNVNGNRTNVNVSGNTINRTVVVANPIYRGPAWGWNRGVVWAPAYGYYGGGFWGPFAVGAASAAVFGAIVYNNTRYTSYQVQPSSPGATMLSNYQLTQTQCGPANLVVVYGPSNSVICAYPNNLVAAGNYNLDTATLSLTSQ